MVPHGVSFATCAVLLIASCAHATEPGPAALQVTPNLLLARHQPTFVVGTLGDDQSDWRVRSEALVLRDLHFPDADIVTDEQVLAAQTWPELALVYGGEHVNVLMRDAGPTLPFRVQRGRIEIAGQVLEGNSLRLVAAVPAQGKRPAFVLFAGTGAPGLSHVNAVKHGAEPWLIADGFGRWKRGEWALENGVIVARALDDRATRIEWRLSERRLWPGAKASQTISVALPRAQAPAPSDEAVILACTRGVQRASERLRLRKPPRITVFVYPDAESKRRVTSRPGAGHADVNSRSLHVLALPGLSEGSLERLVLHEAVHVISDAEWGPAGTEILGEGLAVWAAGTYGGRRLGEWKVELPSPAWSAQDLVGRRFRRLPEEQAYPMAGLLAGALVRRLGLALVCRELLPATPRTWDEACRRAGLSPGEVERLFRLALEPSAMQRDGAARQ